MIQLSVQARRYADWVREKGVRVLRFSPRRRHHAANPDVFRRLTLDNLVGPVGPNYARTSNDELDALERKAALAGYTLVEADPADYDRQLDRHELR